MAVNRRTVPRPPNAVWAVLSDGQCYRDWVVGTSDIRSVDEGFPAVGTSIHYTVGMGLVRHEGHTQVREVDPGRRLVLEAHAWPLGSARIEITLADAPGGGTELVIDEKPVKGLGRRLHSRVSDMLLHARNVETLRRLDRLVGQAQAS